MEAGEVALALPTIRPHGILIEELLPAAAVDRLPRGELGVPRARRRLDGL
jgi:hypothetical protein